MIRLVFTSFKYSLMWHIPLTLLDHSGTFTKVRPIHNFKTANMELKDNHIQYVEFKAKDLEKTKEFYSASFAWTFADYGPTYVAFSDSGLMGGFDKTETDVVNGALIVLYHKDLDFIKNKIIEAGGKITKDIFSFPGGYRFHFVDPSGNELAVWSDKYTIK
jgi:predicted enzyme related to lactoylglutathione lyase